MEAKEAVAVAKKYVVDLFTADGATNIGLEELRFDADNGRWLVTIGFTRPWEGAPTIGRWELDRKEPRPRTFKTVEIADDGKILGLKHWQMAA